MKKNIVIFSSAVLGFAGYLQAQTAAPTKVATIHAQDAVLGTKEGQKAAQDLQTKFMPRRQAIEKKQTDITAIQSQMRTGSATLSEAAKAKLARDFDTNRTELKRASDDFDAEVQQEESKIMADLGQKIMDVVIKYATQNSVVMVVDVSSQQSGVLWADPSIDITNEIIKQYDATHPVAGAAPSPATAKPPAVTPPTTKKQ